MKVKLLLAVIITMTTSAAFTQGFKVGIKGGADINKIDGKPFKSQFSYGYQVGGFAQIGLTSKWGIQPEVLFSQANIDTSESFSDIYDFNSVSKVKLNYLKIPLLLNYSPNPFVTLQAGPQFSILMDQNSSLTKNGRDAFSKGDLSMLAGIQLNISKIKIYGRYGVGLNNINDIDNQEKWKSQNIQVGIGFSIL